jgi:hypothetical protein
MFTLSREQYAIVTRQKLHAACFSGLQVNRENAYPATSSLGHNRYRSNINIGLCGEEYVHTDLKRDEK